MIKNIFLDLICSIYKQKRKVMKIFTTEIINDILDREKKAEIVSRFDRIWHNNLSGVRKANLAFAMTTKELHEYSECYKSVEYFSENHCNIKLEHGDIGKITLRDYQKEILEKFKKNRFNIIMSSRQVGLSVSEAIYILHTVLFSINKIALIVSNKACDGIELIRKIKDIYKLVPFYLKPGVITWNERLIQFDNGCRIICISSSREIGLGYDIDVLVLNDFAKIPANIKDELYKSLPKKDDSRIIITSQPNGAELFHKLFQDAERPVGDPNKNLFVPTRIYWWQVPGRGEDWKQEQIKMMGGGEIGRLWFDQEYDLMYVSKRY
jgi:hypothetical protein